MTLGLVSIVVLNYNGKRFLKSLFDSIRGQSYGKIEVIFVDNGSWDGSVEYVRDNFKEVKVLVNEKNEGFPANNQGIRKSSGEYILILNNDTVLDGKMVEECMKVMTSVGSEFGMGAPKILLLDCKTKIDSIGLNIYPDGMTRQRGRLEEDMGQYDNEEEILLPSGCAGIYKKEMLEEIGLLDEDFFAYCEDSDLGFRGRLAGWLAISIPRSRVYHSFSGYWGEVSKAKALFVERNHLWFALKCFPLSMLWKLPFYTIYRYLVQIYGLILGIGLGAKFVKGEGGWWSLLGVFLKAHYEAIRGLPKMLGKRRRIQRDVKVSGEEIRRWFKDYRIKVEDLVLKD